MVRAASLIAVCVWTAGFVACGTFGVDDDFIGGGNTPGADGSSGLADSGVADVAPGGHVTQDAAPQPTDENCDLTKSPRDSLPCLDFAIGVFVRAGAVGGDGTLSLPYGTFAEARDGMGDKRRIYAAKGVHSEDVFLDRNISIFGGFAEDFKSHGPDDVTEIRGVGGPYVLRSKGGVEALRYEDLKISATADGAAGGSSIAVLLDGIGSVDAIVELNRVEVVGGNGNPGATGGPGSVVQVDTGGFNRAECSGVDVRGGGGGIGGIFSDGAGGSNNANGAGKGGAGSSACTPGNGTNGTNYDAASAAQPGGINEHLSLVDDGTNKLIALEAGGPGATGNSGGGGGGGGAGKKGNSAYPGGGGGRGGCGGTGGGGGGNGGHSIGIMVVNSYVRLVASKVTARLGGPGGPGGGGGPGSDGSGGSGGTADSDCHGGSGGGGGHGQSGGPGGPGVGGASVALLFIGPAVDVQSDLFPGTGGFTGGTSTKSGAELQIATIDGTGRFAAP